MKSRWSLSLGLALVLMPVLVSAADPFLIAVASDDQEATSLVGNFAARSRYYLLFSQTLELVQVVQNPFLSEEEKIGPLIVDYLAQKGVGVIVAGRFGPPMIQAMNKKEMRYIQYSGVAREAVQRAINFLRPPEEKRGGE